MATDLANLTLLAPVTGRPEPVSALHDPVFANGLMGPGVAMEPTADQVVAPVSGEITMVAATKHAFGIRTADGLELLLHLGIDTVGLAGRPFTVTVNVGQHVTAGQPVATMAVAAIQQAGKAASVIVAITNGQAQAAKLFVTATTTVAAGEALAVVTRPLVTTSSADNISAPLAAANPDQPLAATIVAAVGGAPNVQSVVHCMTRLRFKLKDSAVAQTARLKATDGIIDVVQAANQYQVVIGAAVNDVYDAVVKLLGPRKPDPARPEARPQTVVAGLKRGLGNVIGVMTASMVPVIGILAGSGILKGILAALTGFHVLDAVSGTYMVLNALADAVFYFLPIILGITAAKKMAVDPIVMAVVGAVLVYPSLISAAQRATTADITVFGLPTHLVNYSASVFPIIVAAWLAKYVERYLKKWVPVALRSVLVPILEVMVLGLVVLVGIGPLITVISRGIANGIMAVYNLSPALSGLIIGGVYQTMVIFGLHWSLVPIAINDIAMNGHSYLNAILSVTMVAQGGAVLAVFLKTRHQKLKNLSLAAAISAFCGVTEPALYGVNLKYKRLFVIASVVSALGGMLTGLLRVDNFAMSGALVGFPAFINQKVGIDANFYGYLITHYGTLVLTTAAVYLFGFSDRLVEQPAESATESGNG
ncbi:glucose PTS transporter subunit IIA [Lactiplantibacillus plajomi]|uniref:Glucose PTS transporter subunit IIA n=1 Tax=Lactiplantibacillus plajomi TaxID=1457217 RepID=A0ABV6K510_9LACO|nr:glucose PTS transporter subunit IIA [Lactiplantibacillus plajomi]